MSMEHHIQISQGGRVENKASHQLSKEGNEQIFRLLGHKCQTLATCVVQLFLTEPPNHSNWMRRDCGVLCFVKDNVRRSYFFRLYCPSRLLMIWEHEVYNHFEYNAPRPFLHTFEAEDGVAAFNFADEQEAQLMRSVLLEKIEAKKQRKMVRRSRQSMGPPPERPLQPASVNGPALAVASGPPLGPKPARLNQQGRSKWGTKRNSRDKDSARKLTKADIGMPLDFRHVTHVGWDPNKGFDLDNVEDPQLKEFFVKAGVSESQLNDRETRDFIYDFINKHGGIEAVKESFQLPDLPQAVAMHQSAQPQTGPPPPVPARSAPLPSETKPAWGAGQQVRNAPPPPPSRTQAVPAMPASGAAPPLPPSRNPPPPKPPTPQEAAPMAPPPPPPPPMLPPPEQMPPSPTPPPPSAVPAGAPDPRSALLDAIKMGKQLKKVEPGSGVPSAASQPGVGDARGELLDQIRQGIELRRVTPTSGGCAANKADKSVEEGLAGALARALAERSRAIHSDSSSEGSDEEEEDDDEWED